MTVETVNPRVGTASDGPATEKDPGRLVRPEIRELREYALDLSPCRHKLDQNESPYPLPPPVRKRVQRRWVARDWGRYPDFHSDALRDALAERCGWTREGVLVGNGSNELLGVAVDALAGPGATVLGVLPTFSLYRTMAIRSGATPRFLGPRPDLRLPLAELEAAIRATPDAVVVLCTPNNPTGEAVPLDRIERLLAAGTGPLLLDNAYGELADEDLRPILDRSRRVVLFRTFSKAWSMGGLRLGYLLADPEIVRQLIKVKLPYNVGFAASVAGEEALRAEGAVRRRVATLVGRRSGWARMLAGFGFDVLPSQANFLLTRHPRAAAVLEGLAERSIRIRDLRKGEHMDDCLRFSVGDGRALRDVMAALAEILGDAEETDR